MFARLHFPELLLYLVTLLALLAYLPTVLLGTVFELCLSG